MNCDIAPPNVDTRHNSTKGLASYCKAETTFTFYFSILTFLSAFLSINNIEMKSESGFSFAMASQPFWGYTLFQKTP